MGQWQIQHLSGGSCASGPVQHSMCRGTSGDQSLVMGPPGWEGDVSLLPSTQAPHLSERSHQGLQLTSLTPAPSQLDPKRGQLHSPPLLDDATSFTAQSLLALTPDLPGSTLVRLLPDYNQ